MNPYDLWVWHFGGTWHLPPPPKKKKPKQLYFKAMCLWCLIRLFYELVPRRLVWLPEARLVLVGRGRRSRWPPSWRLAALSSRCSVLPAHVRSLAMLNFDESPHQMQETGPASGDDLVRMLECSSLEVTHFWWQNTCGKPGTICLPLLSPSFSLFAPLPLTPNLPLSFPLLVWGYRIIYTQPLLLKVPLQIEVQMFSCFC